MKIASVECLLVYSGWRKNFVFVRVATDAGVVGWGEAYSQYDRDRAVAAQVEEPSASAASFAHAICGWIRPPRPQSVLAITSVSKATTPRCALLSRRELVAERATRCALYDSLVTGESDFSHIGSLGGSRNMIA